MRTWSQGTEIFTSNKRDFRNAFDSLVKHAEGEAGRGTQVSQGLI
jgi:hypothetical protein